MLLLFCFTIIQSSFAIIIDHNYIDSVDSYSQSIMDSVGQTKWFFTHASVGWNILMGLDDLRDANPSHYQYVVSDEVYTNAVDTMCATNPPVPTVAGTIYDCPRGNKYWPDKIKYFSNSVVNAGWHISAVDFVFDKLCFIDYQAKAEKYLASMSALESLYPSTKFVYATMPLTCRTNDLRFYGWNYLRNEYNREVRQFCIDNNLLLFDIADIEAHDTNGIEYTYSFSNEVNQMVWKPYTGNDNSHLSVLGRQRVAKGLYAVAISAVIPEPSTTFLFFIYVLSLLGRPWVCQVFCVN